MKKIFLIVILAFLTLLIAPIPIAYAYQIAVGTYTGNTTGQAVVISPAFQPHLFIVRGRTVNTRMQFSVATDVTCESTNTACYSAGITAFNSDGAQIGTNANVNTLSVVYDYIAIRDNGAADFTVGSYTGNGTDSQDVCFNTGAGCEITNASTTGTADFQPNMCTIKGGSNQQSWRTSAIAGDSTARFNSTGNQADRIQALNTNGYQIGLDAMVNASGTTYYFFCFKAVSGYMAVGTFTGNATDNQDVCFGTGTGCEFTNTANPATTDFAINLLWVKGNSATVVMAYRVSSQSGSNSYREAIADQVADDVQAFNTSNPSGYQVGTSNTVNENAVVMQYAAIGTPPTTARRIVTKLYRTLHKDK